MSISSVAQSNGLEVGLAQTNITPPSGYSHYRGVSTGLHDSLYAKAAVFKMGDVSFALVICDLLWIERDLSAEVRRAVREKTGIPFGNVILSATHTHSGPSYHYNIDQLNEAKRPSSHVNPTVDGLPYATWLSERIAQAVVEAVSAAVPARLSATTFTVDGLAHNRRYAMADGRVVMNPGINNPNVDVPAGPVDRSFPVVLITRISDGKAIGTISNFALHADTFKGGSVFSADFPGYLAGYLSDRFGPDFVSIFATGPCGDINHVDVIGGAKTKDSEAIGAVLSDAIAADSLRDINPDLTALSEYVYLPLQEYTPDELEWAMSTPLDSIFAERSFLTLRRSVKIKSLNGMRQSGEAIPPTVRSLPWTLPLQVQVFKLSEETAIVGMPGELFSAFAVEIRKHSPFKNTIIVELTHCHIAYVPTVEAFSQGGYEAINSRLALGGGELLCKAAIELLHKVNDGQ